MPPYLTLPSTMLRDSSMEQGKDTQGLAKARLSLADQGLLNVITLMATSTALQKVPCQAGDRAPSTRAAISHNPRLRRLT